MGHKTGQGGGITFRTTYNERGEPQRVAVPSGASFESGQVYSPNVVDGEVRPIETRVETDRWGRQEKVAVPTPIPSQAELIKAIQEEGPNIPFDEIKDISTDPEWQDVKTAMQYTPATTTDIDEERSVYQMWINQILGNKRGAQLIQPPEGDFKRVGQTQYIPTEGIGFGKNLAAMLPGVTYPGIEEAGIVTLPDYGQAGLDFAKEQGIKDWGGIIQGLVTGLTPLKYAELLAGEIGERTGNVASNQLQRAKELFGDAVTFVDEATGDAYDNFKKFLGNIYEALPFAKGGLVHGIGSLIGRV